MSLVGLSDVASCFPTVSLAPSVESGLDSDYVEQHQNNFVFKRGQGLFILAINVALTKNVTDNKGSIMQSMNSKETQKNLKGVWLGYMKIGKDSKGLYLNKLEKSVSVQLVFLIIILYKVSFVMLGNHVMWLCQFKDKFRAHNIQK